MNTYALKALGISSVLALALATAACGDDEDAGGTQATGTGASGGSGPGGGGPGGGAQGGGGGTSAANCADYCTDNIATCTGNNVQYLDQNQCEAFCARFEQGTAGEMSGDTLECRVYHLGAAMGSQANQDIHCHHSGPYGGGTCAASGDVCDTFCALAMEICTGPNAAFASFTECASTCAALPDVMTGGYQFSAATQGDGLDCRGYHLQAAVMDPATHCKHVGATDPNDNPCM